MSCDNINANYPFRNTDIVYTVSAGTDNLSKESIDITMKNLDLEGLLVIFNIKC